jgi:bifunctional UDP-N-acetylglucosamine pyrophosphorylase/glucosamine-1-phosphate N-acetyltransferase
VIDTMALRAIVLAAGKGTRMRSDLPKVLHPVAGRPLISWVVDSVSAAGVEHVVVVIGQGADDVAGLLPGGVRPVVQESPDGTGGAARVAVASMGDLAGDVVLIVPGDSPLIQPETLESLLAVHASGDLACTLLTTRMPDPTGYGRVVRDQAGSIIGVVEERDADVSVRAIDEVAVSTYVFDGDVLASALGALTADNDQAEYYLTDAVGLVAGLGGVGAFSVADHTETLGVNSHDQLAEAEAVMRARINRRLMMAGVRMLDPTRVYVEAEVAVEPGATIYPGTHLAGTTRVAAGAIVGPDSFVLDSIIGPGARVWYSVVRGVEVGEGADVGPYASLRPGTILGSGAKAGTFVEVKGSLIGDRSKVPHLSYIGDATIGTDTNVGAGTITCNYDGFRKHHTTIGSRVFIGSDTMLVAPVEIGDGAVTGAGSVITRDVSPGALAVERSPQKEIPGYAERRARLAESEGE